jgi:hypothetical protein
MGRVGDIGKKWRDIVRQAKAGCSANGEEENKGGVFKRESSKLVSIRHLDLLQSNPDS